MRDNAAATDAVFAQRAAAVSAMSTVENMRSYAQIARAYADNTERLANAFDSLYGRVSPKHKSKPPTPCFASRPWPPPNRSDRVPDRKPGPGDRGRPLR